MGNRRVSFSPAVAVEDSGEGRRYRVEITSSIRFASRAEAERIAARISVMLEGLVDAFEALGTLGGRRG